MTEHQQQVLVEIARYRVMTTEALARLFYPDGGEASARKLLSRFVDAGLLAMPYSLGVRKFWQLSQKGTALVGVPVSYSRRLGLQALRDRYGMLAFCALMAHPVGQEPVSLTVRELSLYDPALAEKLRPAAQLYYFDWKLGWKVLARAVVDHEAQAERTVRKCQEIFAHWEHDLTLRAYLPRHFLVTVLTGSPEKKEELLRLFRLLGEEFTYQVRIEAVSQLGHIPVEKRGLGAPHAE